MFLNVMIHLMRFHFPRLPELKVAAMDPDTFRTCKPPDLLANNPNGKVNFPIEVRRKVRDFVQIQQVILATWQPGDISYTLICFVKFLCIQNGQTYCLT